MKPKTLILMIVAVVCGLGASYMTSRLLAERSDGPADAPAVEKVKLLVARNAIEMHKPLGKKPDALFVERDFVKEDAPKDGLAPGDITKLKDKFLKRGLRKGDHITLDDLMDGTSTLTTLPDGMRAVGIPVSSQQTASGFACVPGSHVDVYWTTRTGNDNETVSKVLLEDIVVLAADIRTTNETGGAMPSNVVTVALSPDDSLKMTNAMETGSIRLVLRNLEDRSTGNNLSISRSQLLKNTGSNQKSKDPLAGFVSPTPPEVKPEPPRVDPKTDPEPEPIRATKRTVWVRNGAEVRLHHYWVDDQDRIVPPPGNSDRNYDAVPAPSGTGKTGSPIPDGNSGGGF